MSAEIVWGSVEHHERTIKPKASRRRGRRMCPFKPCEQKNTHMGQANGVTLIEGCEWHVRMWVKDPFRRLSRA